MEIWGLISIIMKSPFVCTQGTTATETAFIIILISPQIPSHILCFIPIPIPKWQIKNHHHHVLLAASATTACSCLPKQRERTAVVFPPFKWLIWDGFHCAGRYSCHISHCLLSWTALQPPPPQLKTQQATGAQLSSQQKRSCSGS